MFGENALLDSSYFFCKQDSVLGAASLLAEVRRAFWWVGGWGAVHGPACWQRSGERMGGWEGGVGVGWKGAGWGRCCTGACGGAGRAEKLGRGEAPSSLRPAFECVLTML